MILHNFIDMYPVENLHATILEFRFISYIFAAKKETKTFNTTKDMT